MLKKHNRFHGRASIKYVFRNGRAVRNRYFSLKYNSPSRRETPRVAVVVSKKISKSAVVRNRIRRRLYETIRVLLPSLPAQVDLVFIVASADISFLSQRELSHALTQAFTQAGLEIPLKK